MAKEGKILSTQVGHPISSQGLASFSLAWRDEFFP